MSKSIFFLFPLTFCLAVAGPINPGPVSVIDKACSQAVDILACQNFLKAIPLSPTTTIANLVQLVTLAGSKEANAAAKLIPVLKSGVPEKIGPETMIRGYLDDCAKDYDNIVQFLDSSAGVLAIGPNPFFENWIYSARMDLESCDMVTKDPPSKELQQVSAKNVYLIQLCHVVLSTYQVFAQEFQANMHVGRM